MPFAGRRRELQEVGRLLERAAGGAGGLLAITGAPGAGKTALAEAAAAEAASRGFEILRAAPAERQPGRLVWAQLLRDLRAAEHLVTRLSAADAGPLDLDAAARHLAPPAPPGTPGPHRPPPPRLIVIDDVDQGGPDAAAMLSVVAARCTASATAMIVTTTAPLGLRGELRLAGLSQADLAEAVRIADTETAHALWVASRGLPGVALPLAQELTAARDAYRRRLGALAAELDAADRAGDGAAAAALEAERQALTDELSRAAGLAGRNRLASREAERARVNVTRTLRAVIERIAPAAPGAAAHLRASVKTGASCRYQPAPGGPSRWHV